MNSSTLNILIGRSLHGRETPLLRPLLHKFKSLVSPGYRRRWRLENLADFWELTLWLERQAAEGRREEAERQCLMQVNQIVRRSVHRYAECLKELDAATDGLLSDPATSQEPQLKLPEGTILLDRLLQAGEEIAAWLDQQAQSRPERMLVEWRRHLDDPKKYQALLIRLIREFGNFELIALALPGEGPVVTSDKVQGLLDEMFQINRRLIRLFELVHGVRYAWIHEDETRSHTFFQSGIDLTTLVREMLAEYMVQADPVRIAQARQRAKDKGRRYQPYRFWRPAEALRQLAAVEYSGSGERRRPRPQRSYVDLSAEAVPVITADQKRLQWAIKEIFNNAIAATARIRLENNHIVAEPLNRLSGPDAPPAIELVRKKGALTLVGVGPDRMHVLQHERDAEHRGKDVDGQRVPNRYGDEARLGDRGGGASVDERQEGGA
ncbi:MAG: hypothetical protein R3336_05375, partial [Phycisphaeraceae bacterium]|nr:hypothetical protein [Phycisphaeraceae bacterium]